MSILEGWKSIYPGGQTYLLTQLRGGHCCPHMRRRFAFASTSYASAASETGAAGKSTVGDSFSSCNKAYPLLVRRQEHYRIATGMMHVFHSGKIPGSTPPAFRTETNACMVTAARLRHGCGGLMAPCSRQGLSGRWGWRLAILIRDMSQRKEI
jgi:hypothetical protein